MGATYYSAGLRAEATSLRIQKAQLIQLDVRSWSRSYGESEVETTQWWRSELDRRAGELDDIASCIEEGRPI